MVSGIDKVRLGPSVGLTHPKSLFNYGKSVPYLIPRPLVQSGEGVSKLKNGVLAGTYRPISSQDAINRRFN